MWTQLVRVGLATACLLLMAPHARAQITFGQEYRFPNVQWLDAISLAEDDTGKVFGCFRKWIDGDDLVQCVVYDRETRQWDPGVLTVPGSNVVSTLPQWHFNLPMTAYNPTTGLLYVAFGPNSRPVDNGLFLNAYDPRTGEWKGRRQVHSAWSERNAMVVTPDGQLHIISMEIEPFSMAHYTYTVQRLRDMHANNSPSANNVRPIRQPIAGAPLGTFPVAKADSRGDIHLVYRFRDTDYFRRDRQTGEWVYEKRFGDFGNRTANNESCGGQSDGNPSLLVDPRNDNVFLFGIPFDLFRPSCRDFGPQDAFMWNRDRNRFTKLSDFPSYFTLSYLMASAMDERGNMIVAWPENFGVHYQFLNAETGQWLPEPLPIPSGGTFDNPDPIEAHGEVDIHYVDGSFLLFYRGQQGRLYSNTLTIDTEPLAAPTNLQAQVVPQGLQLTWNSNYANAPRFANIRVERALDSAGELQFETVATLSNALANGYLDTGAQTDQIYRWRLVVVDSSGQESISGITGAIQVKTVPVLSWLILLSLSLGFGWMLKRADNSSQGVFA